MPALIFHKFVIRPEIHRQGPATVGTVGDQRRWNTHIPLLLHHGLYGALVVKGFLTTWFTALEQPIVTLGIEQPLFIKARLLKAVVYIGGQHK